MNQSEWLVRVDLAASYRLCALNGWDDTVYTHISAAVPGEPGHFLINEFGLRFDEICASNLVKINLEGKVIGRVARKVNVTGFAIHGAVHAARTDAHCVMHLHNTPTIGSASRNRVCCPCRSTHCGFTARSGIITMKAWRCRRRNRAACSKRSANATC